MTEHRRNTVAKRKRTRRRHPARSARLLTVGLSMSAVLGLTALMGTTAPAWTQSGTGTKLGQARPTTPKKVAPPAAKVEPVVVVIHRITYVDVPASASQSRAGGTASGGTRSGMVTTTTRSTSVRATTVPKATPAPKPPTPQPVDKPVSHGGSGGSS